MTYQQQIEEARRLAKAARLAESNKVEDFKSAVNNSDTDLANCMIVRRTHISKLHNVSVR
jgi:hypothetical protein